MRTITTILALLITAAALAQEQQPVAVQSPTYSRDELLRIFANTPEPPEHRPRVEYGFGSISFRALGTQWRFNYLPVMAPLQGTRPTTSREWPDAFGLLGVQYATTPRTWHTRREINRELRRIDRTTKATVKVSPE
jgi:hypothetical protein